MELLLGCGASREKKMGVSGDGGWLRLLTLDSNPVHNPDVVWDMEKLPLPFEADTFREIHAYEVLEHTGQQGDWRFFFDQFSDFHRILKPGGLFFATVPSWKGLWAWGDPSHKRVISSGSLPFLCQAEYAKGIGEGRPMSDFRFCYKSDFDVLSAEENDVQFRFILKANK